MKLIILGVSIFLVFFTMGTLSSSADAAIGKMVLVKGGTYMMGTEKDLRYLSPVHNVTLDSYCIGKFEVTQEEWQAVMGSNPSYYRGDKNPVERVNWYDAIEYCNKRSEKEGLTPCYSGSGDDITCNFEANGYRLPTDAEWEYACIGGAHSRGYDYSGSNEIDEVGWYEGNSGGKPHEVGGKKPNELGIYDMNGNVWEWCWDWYDKIYYTYSPARNPRGAEKSDKRLYRGGGCSGVRHFQLARFRHGLVPDYKECDLGFRVVKNLAPREKVPAGMAPVNGGTFHMGSNIGFQGLCPEHKVILHSFYMGNHEITQEEFIAVMGYNPSWFSVAHCPVDCVSWYEAIEYCNKRSEQEGLTPCYSGSGDTITCNFKANGYRLPTEAEWEYACRGGAQSRNYQYSGSDNPDEVGWHKKDLDATNRPRHVGLKKPNELGLYDMTGNTWEWCWDRYEKDYYQHSPTENPTGPATGINRVLRGGSVYLEGKPSRFRHYSRPRTAWRGFGLRVVRTAD